jgi:phage gp46-like protein
MSFVLVCHDPETQTIDLALDSKGFVSLDGGLETPVLFSLFSNARARPSDGNFVEPFGYWGDDYSEFAGDLYGSHLWLVERFGRLSLENIRRCTVAGGVSLEWMKEDGLAQSVVVLCERADPDTMTIQVDISRPDGDTFSKVWKVHERGIF